MGTMQIVQCFSFSARFPADKASFDEYTEDEIENANVQKLLTD